MIGLDPHAIKELKNIFKELAEQGTTVLISTHMIDSIEDLWDVTYIMQEGEIKACVKKDDEEEGRRLEDIFFEITEGKISEDEISEDEMAEETKCEEAEGQV